MHRIIVNEALTTLRRVKRRQEESIDDLLPESDGAACRVDLGPSQIQTPESLLQRAQTRSAVSAALGISETNVKVRLHRARAAFKKLLEPLHREQNL